MIAMHTNVRSTYPNENTRSEIMPYNTMHNSISSSSIHHHIPQNSNRIEYIPTNSPNTGDIAVTSQSPYTPNPTFQYQSRKSSIPSNDDYPGDFGFQINFGEKTTSAPKSAQYTYSPSLNKLFVKMNVTCPIQFKCSVLPPQGCVIRATPVFKRPEHVADIVTRCPNHKITDNATPSHIPVNHLIRAEMPNEHLNVQYNYGMDGRESVSVTYENPQVGATFSTILFKFMCLSSCVGGINRRPLMISFSLEDMENNVLGRRAVEIRICSCPGRDRAQEEKRSMQQNAAYSLSGKVRKFDSTMTATANPVSNKKHKANSSGEGEEYILKIRGREKYDILKKVKEALDLKEYVAPQQQEMYRLQEREEKTKLLEEIMTNFCKTEQEKNKAHKLHSV